MVGTTKYYPYGECRNSSGDITTDKLFTGQRLDDTGLYYYNARYYDPLIGRFISADSMVSSIGNPQTLNRYSYCLNNPLKYTDPIGHDPSDYYYDDDDEYDPPSDYDDYIARYKAGIECSYTEYREIQEFGLGVGDSARDTVIGLAELGINIVLHPGETIFDAIQAAINYKDTWNLLADYYNWDTSRGRGRITGEALLILITAGIGAEASAASKTYWSNTVSKAGLANKVHHIFGNAAHNLEPLSARFGGNNAKAFRALEVSTQESVTARGITGKFKEITLNVRGVHVNVSGNVINGQARIGTAFIP